MYGVLVDKIYLINIVTMKWKTGQCRFGEQTQKARNEFAMFQPDARLAVRLVYLLQPFEPVRPHCAPAAGASYWPGGYPPSGH